jgi:hypothetical protein
MENFETLTALPSTGGSRFGQVTLGYDRVDRIRTEHSALTALAAVLCPVETLTMTAVRNAHDLIQARAEMPQDELLTKTYASIAQLVEAADPVTKRKLAADAATWLLAIGRRL